MKNPRLLLFVFISLMFQYNYSQTNEEEKVEEQNKVTKDVDKVNEDIRGTSSAVKGAVSDSKDTVNELKETFSSIFGSGNGKKGKSVVSIQIPSVEYDNESLNMMYSQLQKVKGIKKTSKNFKEGNVSIEVTYKNGADALWQSIPFEARKGFKMVEISDNNILLQLKTEGIKN